MLGLVVYLHRSRHGSIVRVVWACKVEIWVVDGDATLGKWGRQPCRITEVLEVWSLLCWWESRGTFMDLVLQYFASAREDRGQWLIGVKKLEVVDLGRWCEDADCGSTHGCGWLGSPVVADIVVWLDCVLTGWVAIFFFWFWVMVCDGVHDDWFGLLVEWVTMGLIDVRIWLCDDSGCRLDCLFDGSLVELGEWVCWQRGQFTKVHGGVGYFGKLGFEWWFVMGGSWWLVLTVCGLLMDWATMGLLEVGIWVKAWGLEWVFHGKVCGLGGKHGSGFSMGGLLKERERCGWERRTNDFDVTYLVPLDFASAMCHSSG